MAIELFDYLILLFKRKPYQWLIKRLLLAFNKLADLQKKLNYRN